MPSVPPYPSDLPICDPHFHLWDTRATPNANLGGIVDAPHPVFGADAPPLGVYCAEQFLRDVGALPFRAALHVETVVGQVPGGFALDTVKESAFVVAEAARALTRSARAPGPLERFGVVAFVQLAQDDAPEVLARHEKACGGALRGVRMIMNWSDADASQCWPQVGHGRHLSGEDATLVRNVRELLPGARGLVFDMHVNWHQLAQAAAFLEKHAPQTVVVLDHLGCLKLTWGASEAERAEDDARSAEWERGMALLAANPRVNVKVSGLEYICPGWTEDDAEDAAAAAAEAGADAFGDRAATGAAAGARSDSRRRREKARALVARALALFGPQRLLVASNFPVDLTMSGRSLARLYAHLHAALAAAGADRAQLAAMFHDNAVRVYGL